MAAWNFQEKAVRVQVTVREDTRERVSELAKRLGVTPLHVASVAFGLGLRRLELDPEFFQKLQLKQSS